MTHSYNTKENCFARACCLLAMLLALALPALAQKPAGKAKHLPEESRLLLQLLKMDRAQIQELQQTIERIGAMTTEEKETLAQRILALHRLSSTAVENLRKGYQAIPEGERQLMRDRWNAMPPETRKAWREKLDALNPKERMECYKREGFLPSMRHKPKCENDLTTPKKERKIQSLAD
jgi:hypothetical protein